MNRSEHLRWSKESYSPTFGNDFEIIREFINQISGNRLDKRI